MKNSLGNFSDRFVERGFFFFFFFFFQLFFFFLNFFFFGWGGQERKANLQKYKYIRFTVVWSGIVMPRLEVWIEIIIPEQGQ